MHAFGLLRAPDGDDDPVVLRSLHGCGAAALRLRSVCVMMMLVGGEGGGWGGTLGAVAGCKDGPRLGLGQVVARPTRALPVWLCVIVGVGVVM